MAGAICCIAGATLIGLIVIKTQTITCRLHSITCPKEVLGRTQELLGSSWLGTNIQATLAKYDLTATKVQRSFPGHLDVTLAYTQTTQKPQVEPTDRASSLLSQTGIDHTAVTLAGDAALVVELKNGLTALIDLYDMEASVQRLNIILEGTDFASLDSSIVEIDTRFKLPVLRTTLSFPASASASTTTLKEDNS